MKKLILTVLLLSVSALPLFAKGLRIADTIIFEIPVGWTYEGARKEAMPRLGMLTSTFLENPSTGQKLTVSVLKAGEPEPGVQYSTELIEATLSPYIEAYRKQGSHYYPRKILGRGDFVFYDQEVGRLEARKVELRGVLMKKGDDWVNFFCIGPNETSWEQYQELITGTKLLN